VTLFLNGLTKQLSISIGRPVKIASDHECRSSNKDAYRGPEDHPTTVLCGILNDLLAVSSRIACHADRRIIHTPGEIRSLNHHITDLR
jgi:hypothetical protein